MSSVIGGGKFFDGSGVASALYPRIYGMSSKSRNDRQRVQYAYVNIRVSPKPNRSTPLFTNFLILADAISLQLHQSSAFYFIKLIGLAPKRTDEGKFRRTGFPPSSWKSRRWRASRIRARVSIRHWRYLRARMTWRRSCGLSRQRPDKRSGVARSRTGHSINRSAPQANRSSRRPACAPGRSRLKSQIAVNVARLVRLIEENVGKETILKVTDWLRGIWEMRRRAGGPVQQWIDSIPSPTKSDVAIASEYQEHSLSQERKPLTPTGPKDIPFSKDSKTPSMTVSAPINVPNSPAMNTPIMPSSLPHHRLARDASFQSDSSHCSSVESLLELRRADPAEILLDLGFGGSSACPQENGIISRIPERFLQPSSLRGIAVDEFLKQQQETTESFDSVSLGYRGLTGSPYVAPSEIVQKIMDRLREHESHEMDTSLYNCDQYGSLHQNGKLSVLSPDNRQFLEQPRSKSPDMRNKRMIIGQKSFTFGRDGNLIEVPTGDAKLTSSDAETDHDNTLDAGESVELMQSSPEGSVTFQHRYLSKSDKKLAKQLSFDDTGEFSETDQLSKDDWGTPSSLNIAQSGAYVDDREQEYNAPDTTPKRHEFSDTRRASDGSFDTKSLEDKILHRRFSDGAVRIIDNQSKEGTLTQKRRSLKRQSRICDATAMRYCALSPIRSSIPNIIIIEPNVDEGEVSSDVINNTQELNMPESFGSTEDKNDPELKPDAESPFRKPNYMPSPSNVSESVDRLERFETAQEDSASSDHSCAEDNQACCYKGKVCRDCKHAKNSLNCCYRADKRKYRKKMEKIMQENKILEDMLARSRREVAEIRDMLSSVLSVRMEPGF